MLISLALLTQCWDADFINYDDVVHIQLIPQVYGRGSVWDLFGVPIDDQYKPITYLSYRLDNMLFCDWMIAHWHNWAPAVRLMSWVYHACASLVLWRIMLLLGLGRLPSLFCALVFAVHPACCETVCWASERKNALGAMFGFSAIYCYLSLDGRWRRWLVAFVLYALAACSKATALGFLPLLGLIELFNGAAGIRGEQPLRWRPGRPWGPMALRLAPLAALSAVLAWLNVHGHAGEIVPPPGGSVFTALLTDVEILLRYLGMMLAPVRLSIAYYVEPIVSLLDPRLIGYGLVLAAVVAGTIHAARSRRRAAFGWLWFIAALTPCLNIIAISYPMQDRYIYFSMPGFFLALTEAILGLQDRVKALTPFVMRATAACFVALLTAGAMARGAVFRDAYFLFKDGTEKQPRSAFAHYGLGNSYTYFVENMDKIQNPDANSVVQRNDFAQKAVEERRLFLECPDAERQVFYATVATSYGEDLFQQQRWAEAEQRLMLAAYPKPGILAPNRQRAMALRDLAVLRLAQKNPAGAYTLAQQALDLKDYPDRSLLLRAKSALALAGEESREGHADRAAELKVQARADLVSVPNGADAYSAAQQLLTELNQARQPEHAP